MPRDEINLKDHISSWTNDKMLRLQCRDLEAVPPVLHLLLWWPRQLARLLSVPVFVMGFSCGIPVCTDKVSSGRSKDWSNRQTSVYTSVIMGTILPALLIFHAIFLIDTSCLTLILRSLISNLYSSVDLTRLSTCTKLGVSPYAYHVFDSNSSGTCKTSVMILMNDPTRRSTAFSS